MASINNSNLAYKSVGELAPLLESGELSPVDLTRSSLDRIAQLQSTLNAFLEVWEESALEDARVAEAEIAAGRYL
ncbi:MAG TPA: Asp-tRNA(Asn)/Glu-tRNA(Gln) amidotransferase GatCAB subunit A, partial [Dehalococcoidia bacterium]|nr:Asp-tRNA(Asn)/Glu-tRNA(Gln) amidotransferase GatCAB subunit A [Dehalococcoidia bacterium]